MVATASERPSNGFVIFSILSVISVGMFAVNLGATMLLPPKPAVEEEEVKAPAAPPPPPPPAAPVIVPDMRVGEILTRWPQTVEVFVGHGFSSLSNPEHREQVKQIPITLRMACERHNVDLDYMVSELNGAVAPAPAKPATAAKAVPGKGPGKAKLSRGEPIGADHILGDILSAYPETEKVFRKYYGEGCFSCPGQATESVQQSAMMHNVSAKQLLAELNQAAEV
jgi:hybrid cluster-associated redox disulfide protein